MKRGLLAVLAFALSLAACVESPEDLGGQVAPDGGGDPLAMRPQVVFSAEDAIPGQIIVKIRSEVYDSVQTAILNRSGELTSGLSKLDAWMRDAGAVRIEPLFRLNPRFAERDRAAGIDRWYIIHFDEGYPLDRVAPELSGISSIEVVEYALPVENARPERVVLVDPAEVNAARQAQGGIPYNDPMGSRQWHYYNDGTGKTLKQYVAGADINVVPAWAKCAGLPDVIVAVIDSGVDYEHPDLAANMWVNSDEVADGKDTDGNGFIDDIHGFNFKANSPKIVFQDHGTHTAGTVAAVNNNGVGVCGVAGGSGQNDGVRLMSCDIFNGEDSGAGPQSTLNAFTYAAQNGAVVCTNSWGYHSSGALTESRWMTSYYSAERDAINYFIQYAGLDPDGNQVGPIKGGVVVFSAGNDGYLTRDGRKSFPAAYAPTLSVSAMAADCTPSIYTDYGTWVDVSAPGGDSWCVDMGVLSTVYDVNAKSHTYGYMDGTSMACPHVAGVAALGASYAKKLGVTLTGEELKAIIEHSTHDFSSYMVGRKTYYSYSVNLPDYVGKMGSGYVDAALVLAAIDKMGVPDDHVDPVALTESAVELSDGIYADSLTLDWAVTADYTGEPLVSYVIEYAPKQVATQNATPQSLTVEVGSAAVGDKLHARIVGLTPGTTYELSIYGTDQWSKSSDALKLTGSTREVPAPAAPETPTFATGDVKFVEMTMRWTAGSDRNDGAIDHYMVYWDDKSYTDVSAAAHHAQVNGAEIGKSLSYKMTALKPSTTYYVALVAVDRYNQSSPAARVEQKTAEADYPDAVTALKATSDSYHTMTVSWTVSRDCTGEANRSYTLYWGTQNDQTKAQKRTVNGQASGTITQELTGLTDGTTYHIWVVAKDQYELESTAVHTSQSTVKNQAPTIVAETPLALSVQYWSSDGFAFRASDPLGDSWTVELTDAANLLKLRQEGDLIHLDLKGDNARAGQYTASIRVVDTEGLASESLALQYTIIGNVAPVGTTMGNLYLTALNSATTIDLSSYFTDGNGESLTFETASTGTGVNATISGNQLSVSASRYGLSTITVTATDHAGATASVPFQVMARDGSRPVELYPNPVVSDMNIRMGQEVSGQIDVEIYSAAGAKVYDTTADIAPFAPARVNLSHLSSGSYVVDVTYNGVTYKNNIVKK